MRRWAGLAIPLFLLSSGSAGGAELVSAGSPAQLHTYTRWLDRAAMPAPPGSVRVVFAGCPAPGEAVCTVHGPTPTIYVGRAGTDRMTFLHEVGHVFDAQVLADADRAALAALLAPGRPWRAPPDSAHERFAEAYAHCATAPRARGTWRGGYGYVAAVQVHRRACALIRRAGLSAQRARAASSNSGG